MPESNKPMYTRSFSVEEMACKCCNTGHMDAGFMRKLQLLRDWMGDALIVNCGYRCAKHNKEVGGAEASFHLVGRAADISVPVGDYSFRYRLLKGALEIGFGGVEISPWHVHVDDRPPSRGVVLIMDKQKGVA